jgi:hypothetical protein
MLLKKNTMRVGFFVLKLYSIDLQILLGVMREIELNLNQLYPVA